MNIGDIGHTPGLLHLFETFLPKAKVILWKKSKGEEVKKLLNKNFPRVKIIYGNVNADKDADNPEVMEAMKKADLMIHGSGPLLVGADNLACWLKHTNKPFGVFGTTLQNPNEYHQTILKKASFIYTRETQSIDHLNDTLSSSCRSVDFQTHHRRSGGRVAGPEGPIWWPNGPSPHGPFVMCGSRTLPTGPRGP